GRWTIATPGSKTGTSAFSWCIWQGRLPSSLVTHFHLDSGQHRDHDQNHEGHRGRVAEVGVFGEHRVIDVVGHGDGHVARPAAREVDGFVEELQRAVCGHDGRHQYDRAQQRYGDARELLQTVGVVDARRLVD